MQNLMTMKSDSLNDIKHANEAQTKAISEVKGETARVVKKVEDFIKVDPLPQERIDKLKGEIKAEIEEIIQNMSPLAMRRRVSEKQESSDALQEMSVEEVAGELGAEIAKIKDLVNRKIDKLDDTVLDRQQVVEAKLRKMIGDNKDRFSKAIKKEEDAISKI